MTEEAVRVEKSGPVGTDFLQRPARRNAVDDPTAAQLAAVFRAFDADPEPRGADADAERTRGGAGARGALGVRRR